MTAANFGGLAREALIADAEASLRVGGLAREALIAQSGLDAAAGTVTHTGKAVTTNAKIAPGSSSHSANGQSVKFNPVLSPSAGSFHLTGQVVTFATSTRLSVSRGLFSLTGEAATLGGKLTPDAGTFTLTGEAALESDQLTAGTGLFALSEQDATLDLVENADPLLALIEKAKGAGGLTQRLWRRRIEGWARFRLPPFWLSAAGEFEDPPEGELEARFTPHFTLRALGAVGVAGEARFLIRDRLALSAEAFVAPCGELRAAITPLLRASGRHDHFSDAELALLPLLLEL